MRIECQECGFIGNKEVFEKSVMVDDSTGKGQHEETEYKCPKCPARDGAPIAYLDDATEITRKEGEDYLWELHAEDIVREIIECDNGGSISLDEILQNGFVGYRKMTVEQLNACMPEYPNDKIVLSDEEYKEVYGEDSI